jgi:hypothetical protein
MILRSALSASVAMNAIMFASVSAWAQDAPVAADASAGSTVATPKLVAKSRPLVAQSEVKSSSPGRTDVGVAPALSTQAIAGPIRYYKGKGPCFHNNCLFRFEEDYSYMRNGVPAGQKDFFDPIKYIPLDHSGDVYLSFNGAERASYFHDLLFNTVNPVGDRNEVDLRTNIGSDLHLGPHVRVYADLWNGQYFGPNNTPSARYLNDVTTENLFVELMDTVGQAHLGLRVGEQFLSLGDGLVLADTELSNIPNTWDGFRAYADWGFARVDAFAFDQQLTADGHFHGHPSSQGQLAGVYGSYDLPELSLAGVPVKTSVDPYYLYFRKTGYSYDDPSLQTGTAHGQPSFALADSVRDTFGLRYYGTIGAFDLDDTVEFQGGGFGSSNVSAWMFAFNNGYNFALPWKPRLGFHLDGASGGASRNGHTINTYQPLYYSALYYNANLLVSPTNFYDLGPHVTIKPTSWVTVDFSDTFLWRQNQHDAIYNGLYAGGAAVNLYSQTANIRGAYTGNQIGTLIITRVNSHIDVFTQLAYFLPGSPLRQIGADDQFEMSVLASYKF